MIEYIRDFLEVMKVEDGLSENTVLAYERDLTNLILFLKNVNKSIEQVDIIIFRQYLRELAENHKAPSTRARHISANRKFFSFLKREGYIAEDPTQLIESPKLGVLLPKFLSKNEVLKLLENARKQEGMAGCRLVALIEVLYATGMRVTELVGLQLRSISRDGKFVLILGKGAKERMLPLNEYAQEAVSDYLTIRRRSEPFGAHCRCKKNETRKSKK